MRECRTCPVYHVDQDLCVVPSKEGPDCVILVLTGEDRLYQGGEFVRNKLASNQTSAYWSVEVEK